MHSDMMSHVVTTLRWLPDPFLMHVGRLFKKEREKKGSARGSVQGRCDYTTALDIEVDP